MRIELFSYSASYKHALSSKVKSQDIRVNCCLLPVPLPVRLTCNTITKRCQAFEQGKVGTVEALVVEKVIAFGKCGGICGGLRDIRAVDGSRKAHNTRPGGKGELATEAW
jgi:hypothetical protein